MDEATRKRLVAAGHEEVSVQELLGLTDEEMQLVELRVTLSKQLAHLREQTK